MSLSTKTPANTRAGVFVFQLGQAGLDSRMLSLRATLRTEVMMRVLTMNTRRLWLGAIGALMIVAVACDSADVAERICDPGATQACICPSAEGAQSCNEDGSGWETCVCAESEPSRGVPVEDTTPDEVIDSGDATDTSETGDDASEPSATCTPNAEKACEGDTLVWLDSCGVFQENIEDCAQVGYCSDGACVSACLPQHERRCKGNDVYWFDSCGSEGGQAEACAPDEFCEGCKPEDANCAKEGECVKATLSGTWLVTADPSSQSVMGGDVPFLPAMVDLNIDGTDVTGYAEVGAYVINYVGTLTGKNLKMTGEYTESSALGDVDHVEVYDVHFSDPETFSGLNSDTFSVPVFGEMTIYWNLTGVKQ